MPPTHDGRCTKSARKRGSRVEISDRNAGHVEQFMTRWLQAERTAAAMRASIR
jgi:hypothetical protein